MRIRTAVPTWRNLAEVTQGVADIAKGISAGWNIEHKPDGTHSFPWAEQTFAASHFSGSTTMTWAVASVLEWRYRLVGKTMEIDLGCSGTVAGTPTAALLVQIPNGMTAARDAWAGAFSYVDAGTAGTGVARVIGTKIYLFKNLSATAWTAGTAQVAAVLRFEVQ